MKTMFALLSILSLAACARQAVQPTGVYRLGTADKTMVLDIRASGDYVLQIDGPGSMSDEIRGRWQDERNGKIDLTFQGIVWHGNEPEAARASWPVRFEDDGSLCIDGAERHCFRKDEAAQAT